MLRSCKYCGRIHDAKEICAQKKQAEKRRWEKRKQTKATQFRRSDAWTEKSIRIRQRDKYMCLCCKAMLKGTIQQYNTKDLSVHHITPIEEDYDLRLEDENLITVCGIHHEMCEAEEISRDVQRDLAVRSIQEDTNGEESALIVM